MSALFLILAIFLFFYTYTFPTFQQYALADASFWPRIVLALLIFVAAMAFIESLQKYLKAKKTASAEEKEKGGRSFAISKGTRQLIYAFVLLFIYVLLGLPYMGFLLSTFLYLMLFMLLAGNRKPVQYILFPILICIISVYVFGQILYVPLPRGVGIFQQLSFLLY